MACGSQADSCSTMAQMSAGSSEWCAAVVRASAMSVALSAGGAAVSELGGKAEECGRMRWVMYRRPLAGVFELGLSRERRRREGTSNAPAGGQRYENRGLTAAVV